MAGFVKEIGKAIVKGGAKGGGTLGTPFRAIQTGTNAAKGIRQGFDTYNKKTAPKPAKTPKPAAKPKAVAKPATPAKPKTAPKPAAKPKKK